MKNPKVVKDVEQKAQGGQQARNPAAGETPKGPKSEPRIQNDSIREFLDQEAGPKLKGGAVQGDQQALNVETQFGAVPEGTAHRGRDSKRYE